ncbi:hypothetical protein M8J76_016897 [Diaphorina citri]|nr:hypothetical protein M8J76_016897 [Diaphorina citri]
MRENRASSGKQTKVMNGNGTDGVVRVESYMKSPTRRIPMRSSTPVRNGHSKREKQKEAENRNFSPRSSSLISRRKKVSEPLEIEKPVEPEIWLQPDTYDILNSDIIHIKRSLMCLSRLLVQNGEGELETDRESNGHHKTDSEYSDERNLQDLKEKVLQLQRESEEKNKIIENLRNEINAIKQNRHVSYATKATQTEDYLDVYNNNADGQDENAKHLVRTVSDTASHKTSSSKFSKVPILPWRHRSTSSSRKK